VYRALVAWRRGALDDALRFAQDAVRAREDAARIRGRDAETTGLAHALTALAWIQSDRKRFDEAERAAARALAIVDKPGPNAEFRAWWTAETHRALGRIYREQKRYAEARREYQLDIERNRALFGDSVRVASGLAELARVFREEGDIPGALGIYRRLADIQLKDAPTRNRARPDSLAPHLDTLLEAATAAPDQRQRLLAEAFVAAQIPWDSETARAITNMAARLDAADPAIRAAAREYQEASRERDRVRRTLALETLDPPDKREPKREAALKQELRTAEDKVAQLEVRLQADLPRYARLTAPRPLSVAEAAQTLRAGEALLTVLPTRDATYVFLVRDGQAHVHRAALSRADLERAVKQLRASFEVTDGKRAPFDVVAAHRLYQLLVAPVAGGLGGVTHLITVPAGPLLSLPLAVLVTKAGAPADPTDYRQVPWLAREFAISVLPSTGSLRDLRRVAGRSSAPRPFIGFGDPLFAGVQGDNRSMAAMGSLCRQGEPMDADLVRALPRLPETAQELAQIARSLGADASAVVLGGQVTETNLRTMDLSQYRVVAFATHGLLPGELRCKAEPALALTPPATASATDDGLLDAGEVAQLRLDADWVVLSACNTAGPDGKLGGESLSGLARAFFYAGARALLVSHWAVASQATVALTTGMFQAYGRDPALGRAEALRRSQTSLWSQQETSHPLFWAPFTVVGDGGARPSQP
jgi:CHAT domain-containing protein